MKVYSVDVRWDNLDTHDCKKHAQFNLGAFQTRDDAIEAICNFNKNPLAKMFAALYNCYIFHFFIDETEVQEYENKGGYADLAKQIMEATPDGEPIYF